MPRCPNSKLLLARTLPTAKPRLGDPSRAPLAAKRHRWTDSKVAFISSGSGSASAFSTLHRHRTTSSHRHHQQAVAPLIPTTRLRLFSTMSSATSFFDFKVPDGKPLPLLSSRIAEACDRLATPRAVCAKYPADNEVPLSNYKGKVVLVVNTASKCGFTYQYKNLESVYQAIKKEYPDDFVVLGFPCNQFGSQEPGSNEEIQNFCTLDQKVTFPVLGKINVNGDDAHPLYKWLKKEKPGLLGLERVKWNFEKFLIGRDGKVIGRWASTTEPEKIQDKIIEAIKQPAP
ncbi:Glutathione peroxidase [Trichoderma ghanense]|uniref:Glutathione peroxidase n=1 Tax=Trichoderma ghanense TaxID=65468 RepID=A0ABY2H8H4_9HYPO